MSITEQAVGVSRNSNGVDIPAPGTWGIDPSHSTVEFVVKHLMFSKVRGGFTDFTGSVQIADDPLESSVNVTIQAASISTRDSGRDEHLRGEDFFDAAAYPELTFRSTSVSEDGAGRWRVQGELGIKDVTRPVELHLELNGLNRDPWGNERALYSASAEINREEFGLTWNQALETGGVLVGKSARIELEISTVLQADAG